MAQNWDSHVNRRAYGLSTGGVDNLQEIEFDSGRTVTYKRNSLTKKEHAVKFVFDDSQHDPEKLIDGKTEFQWFIRWLDVTLQGLTQSFYFDDIIAHTGVKEYRLKDYPSFTGQKWKYATMTFVEV